MPRSHLPSRIITPPGPRREQTNRWVDLAIHYYISARAATFWGHRPNADVQAHHAIELALKWALVRPVGGRSPWPGRNQARTKQQVRGHDLMKLWTMLNQDYPGHALARFSRYVQQLNRVELLMQRYAEMPSHGAVVYVDRLEDVDDVSGAEVYAIDLPRLDELLHGLLALTETDPLVVRAGVVPRWPNEVEAEDYYRRNNSSALPW